MERFVRSAKILGPEALQCLHKATVAVVGLGAVGSYAVEGLARSGVGNLRLVDFDVIRKSNINRQLYALESTLDQQKTQVARKRVLDINPRCNVEILTTFAHRESMAEILAAPVDLVIDAIDSLNPKSELLISSVRANIPVISAMGAAMRTDPARVRVGPLFETRGCPLARMVRKRLRNRGMRPDITVVYSDEAVPAMIDNPVVPESEEEDFHPRGRRRQQLGSLPTITGIFGLTLANLAIKILIDNGKPGISL